MAHAELHDALHAATRFGLGPRLGEPPPPDPRGWLLGQLDGPDPALAVAGPSVADGHDRAEPGQATCRCPPAR